MTIAIAILLITLVAILTLASYVERIYHEKGKFLSREFQENIEAFDLRVEPRLKGAASRAPLSVAVLTRLCTAGVAMATVYLVMKDGRWSGGEIAQAVVALILVVLIFNRLLPFIFFTRTRGEWLVPFAPILRLLIYLLLPI